jgi:ATP synthase F1 gamma subunit
MASAQEINETKGRIGLTVTLKQEMTAQVGVAISEIQRTQETLDQVRPFYTTLLEPLSLIIRHNRSVLLHNPLCMDVHDSEKPIALVLIGTDRALCGTHNDDLVEKAFELKQKEGRDAHYIAIGRQVVDVLRNYNHPVTNHFPSTTPEKTHTMEDVIPMCKPLLTDFQNNKYSRVYALHYNDAQELAVRQMLPIPLFPFLHYEDTIHPTFEPDNEKLVTWVLTRLFYTSFYNDFLTSALREFNVRLLTASTAKVGAQQLHDELGITYNTLRRGIITNQVIELGDM